MRVNNAGIQRKIDLVWFAGGLADIRPPLLSLAGVNGNFGSEGCIASKPMA